MRHQQKLNTRGIGRVGESRSNPNDNDREFPQVDAPHQTRFKRIEAMLYNKQYKIKATKLRHIINM